MEGLNWGTYYFFRDLPPQLPRLTAVMHAVDIVGSAVVLGLTALVVLMLLLRRGNHRAAIVALAIVLIGTVIVEGVNRGFGDPRPPRPDKRYADADLGPSLVSRTAFCSSLVLGLLAGVWWSAVPSRGTRGGLLAGTMLLVLLVGFSQLYLSLEFLTALLAGWAAGAFALLVCWQLAPLGAPEAP